MYSDETEWTVAILMVGSVCVQLLSPVCSHVFCSLAATHVVINAS